MNKVVLIGNLVRDPELTQTGSGISMCRITIAVNRSFTNSNGEREADFFDITVWRTQAENCHKYLRKGLKIAVSGSLQKRTVEAADGTKKYYTDIIADDVEFLTPRGDSGPRNDEGYSVPPPAAVKKSVKDNPPITDDDLPF
jgi:single-strand DNA-binding protein